MDIQQRELDKDILKVVLSGALDIAGSSDIDGPISEASSSRKKVIIDISGVDFMASIGIRVFVKAAKAMASVGGRMSVFGAQDMPKKVILSTGVDRIIDLADSEEDAIKAVTRFD